MPVKVTDKRHPVYKKTMAALLSSYQVNLGLHDDTPEDVMLRGLIHEFGSSNLPQRSFLRRYADVRIKAISRKYAEAVRRVVTGMDPQQSLDTFSEWIENDIRRWIRAGNVEPPLKPSTIINKGHSTPLIHSGELLAQIKAKAKVMK